MDEMKIKTTFTYYLKNDYVIAGNKKTGWEILLTAGTPLTFHKKIRGISGQSGTEYYIFNVFNSFLRFKVESSKLNHNITDFAEEATRSAKESDNRTKELNNG